MRVIRKDLERHRVYILSLIIFGKAQLDELTALERLAIYRVGTVLLDPWQDVGQVKDGALGGADGMLKGLERDGAEVEG